jgi:hypothetical protein
MSTSNKKKKNRICAHASQNKKIFKKYSLYHEVHIAYINMCHRTKFEKLRVLLGYCAPSLVNVSAQHHGPKSHVQ